MIGLSAYINDGSLYPYYKICNVCKRLNMLWSRHIGIYTGECKHKDNDRVKILQ